MARLLSIAAGVHPDLAPERMVEVAARAGWPACGIWFDPDSWTDSTTRAVRQRLDDTGIVGLDLEPIIPAPDQDDHGERVVETAAQLGVRFVLFTSRLPDLAATGDRFAELCDVASRVGVQLVCEFLPIFPLKSLAMALEVVTPHSPDVAGVLVDNLHLSRSGARPEDLSDIDTRRLPYLQIADASRETPVEFMALLDEALNGRLLPGDGALPIDELLTIVPEVPLSFEVRSRVLRESFTDPVERARFLLETIESSSMFNGPDASS
jgi:sugar phosphate isomerase/epimerase